MPKQKDNVFGGEELGFDFTYPKEWLHDQEGERDLFYAPNEIGTLRVIAYDKTEHEKIDFDPLNILKEYMLEQDMPFSPEKVQPTRVNGNNAAIYEYTERDTGKNEVYTKLAIVTGDNKSVFFEYTCLEDEKGSEKRIIEKIIYSAQLY